MVVWRMTAKVGKWIKLTLSLPYTPLSQPCDTHNVWVIRVKHSGTNRKVSSQKIHMKNFKAPSLFIHKDGQDFVDKQMTLPGHKNHLLRTCIIWTTYKHSKHKSIRAQVRMTAFNYTKT
jgi:hypothetical protein